MKEYNTEDFENYLKSSKVNTHIQQIALSLFKMRGSSRQKYSKLVTEMAGLVTRPNDCKNKIVICLAKHQQSNLFNIANNPEIDFKDCWKDSIYLMIGYFGTAH